MVQHLLWAKFDRFSMKSTYRYFDGDRTGSIILERSEGRCLLKVRKFFKLVVNEIILT